MTHNQLTEYRQSGAFSAALEQLETQVGLQAFNAFAQCRLGNIQSRSGPAKMRMFGNTEQMLQANFIKKHN
nr:hypothetical protein [Pseudomonas pohangensis]